MKKLLKSKIFWLFIAIIIIIVIVIVVVGKDKNTSIYTTQKVELIDLKQTVSATGKVQSAEEINLSFETNGRIAQINTAIGKTVKAGEVLVTLQSSDLASKVTKARASLTEAQARLAKVIAGSTQEEIEIARTTVAKAQTDLDNAKTDLADTKLTYSQDIENAKEDAISEGEKAITKAEISLNTGNDIITNDDYDSYLSVLASNYLVAAENDYLTAVSKVAEAKNSNAQSKIEYDDVKVDKAISDTLIALDKVVIYLSDVSNVLSNSIIGGNLTQTKLDALKVDINTERTTTDSSKASVLSSKQALADAKLDYTTEVNDAQAAVNSYQEVLATAQAELDLKLAPSRQEDINLYQAQVRQAEAELLITSQNLSKTKLIAPTDGLVIDVKNEIGERIAETNTVITMLATGPYEIEVNIPESDIAKINSADTAEITLDAFTDDIVFLGNVTMVNPAQTEIQDVIYYKVTISLDAVQPEEINSYFGQIKPGMTANVDVLTNMRTAVLVIPQRAVKSKNGTNYVQVLENNQVKDINVTLGLRGDDGMVEVVSGLSEGQEVITFVKNNK